MESLKFHPFLEKRNFDIFQKIISRGEINFRALLFFGQTQGFGSSGVKSKLRACPVRVAPSTLSSRIKFRCKALIVTLRP